MQPEEALAQLQAAAGQFDLPELAPAQRIDWHRHGLMALHGRLEDLKTQAAVVGTLQELAARWRATSRLWLAEMRERADDAMAAGIEPRVSVMVNRGMAADERMLSHRHRASAETIMVRQFERADIAIEQIERRLTTRERRLRDERNDIYAQVRLINVAVQIQEL